MSFLGLDIGTTSVKVFAFDENWEILECSSRPLPIAYPSPGRAVQDPGNIIQSSIDAMKDVAQRLPLPPVAIGIANQRETVTAWDRNTREPLAPAISWQDRRGELFCENLKRSGAEDFIRDTTGLTLDPYFSATKYSDLASSLGKSLGTVAMGTLDTWILANLTGSSESATDFSNASRTSLFDIDSGNYLESLASLFNVPLELLPHVRASNSLFGEITHPYLTEWRGVPVHAILGDQQASLFGQGCTSYGDCKATLGTGTFALTNIGDHKGSPVMGLVTSIAWNLTGKGSTYCLEGSILSGAAMLDWLVSAMGIAESTEDLESLALSVRSSEQVTLLPFFGGTGAPWWNEESYAVLGGLDLSTTKAHLVRAGFEAIALHLAEVTKTIKDHLAIDLKELRIDGGLSNLDFLCQLISDHSQLSCNTSYHPDSAAFGAAMMAALGVGALEFHDIGGLPRVRKRYEPSPNRTASKTRAGRWNRYLGKLGLPSQ